MDNFKLASKQKLRFQTNRGLLSTEQLWDLGLEDLNSLAVALDNEQTPKKSFLTQTSDADKTAKLRFEIALDILNAKVEEREAAKAAAEKRENNKKILEIIADKKDESLKGKTIKQLESMLQ